MRPSIIAILVATIAFEACSYRSQSEDIEPGAPVDALDPVAGVAGYEELRTELQRSRDWSVDDFADHYAPTFEAELGYSPSNAEFVDLIDDSSFALSTDERSRFERDGFAYLDNYFPSFAYGYQTIYVEDLPVYVSADAILFAMHRSYDEILKTLEYQVLAPDLAVLLDEMRIELKRGAALGFTANQETDLDLYLAVAATLLGEAPRRALVGADQALIDSLVDRAIAASGSEEVSLFGSKRQLDWSQFEPRGHYAGDEQLERYFRTMMWLGRVDFRILEPNDQNVLEFRRRQFYDTLALINLLTPENEARFVRSHEIIGAFVGEADGLVATQLPELLTALGVEEPIETKTMSDADIALAIQKHSLGAQRIASHFMTNGLDTTKPLAHSFALMGQRYVVDSHVFSNVVYDRIGGGDVYRMMPDPLDVAFAALANNQAGVLLDPQLREFGYQHELDASRQLVDAHDETFWSANLYNRWLSALRTLSPTTANAAQPAITRTEPWGRRVLQAQLASWAELRHDTILYAKQSYTTGAACEYPDAYVEPYPAFFAAVSEFAVHGSEVVGQLDEGAASYFSRLGSAADRLEAMATQQLSGEPHDPANLAWINDAVVIEEICGSAQFGETGWYRELFYSSDDVDFDPTIADVHTQPTDESGNVVGRVLHVGTGQPRAMIVSVETCVGPRAYVGIASSYHEVITQNFERLNDDDWANLVTSGSPVSPDWTP